MCIVAETAAAAKPLQALGPRVYVWENSVEQFRIFIHFHVLWFCSSDAAEKTVILGPDKGEEVSSLKQA